MIAAVTVTFLDGDQMAETLNQVIDCKRELRERSETPQFRVERGKPRLWVSLSEMKETDGTLSSIDLMREI